MQVTFVTSAHADYAVVLAYTADKLAHQLRHIAEAHTAGHNQIPVTLVRLELEA